MSEDIKKGLLGIVVDETTISQVMPDINSLTYRGYAVQDLCKKCIFEEVAYLVLNGELPNKKQLRNFVKEERLDRKLSKEILSDIRKMPKKAHPMDVVRTAVSLMALDDAGLTIKDMEALYCGNLGQSSGMVGQRILQEIGQTGMPVVNCANACATGATAFREAWTSIKAGLYDVVLAVGVEQMGKGLLGGTGAG